MNLTNLNIQQVLLIISAAILLFVNLRVIIFHYLTLKYWQKTKGRILDFDIKWFQQKSDSDTEGWKEMIKYEYEVDSIKYQNDKLSKNLAFLSNSKSFAGNNDFKSGQTIVITYDPKNPKDSVIVTKFNPWISITMFVAMAFLFFLIF